MLSLFLTTPHQLPHVRSPHQRVLHSRPKVRGRRRVHQSCKVWKQGASLVKTEGFYPFGLFLFLFLVPLLSPHTHPSILLTPLPLAKHTHTPSRNRYIENDYTVVPVNPREETIETLNCVPNLSSLPGSPAEYHVSIITPPVVTKSVLEEAHKNGIKKVWLQPDVDSKEALEYAKDVGLQVIAGGPCVLVDGIRSKL